jgi:hypothetical protein
MERGKQQSWKENKNKVRRRSEGENWERAKQKKYGKSKNGEKPRGRSKDTHTLSNRCDFHNTLKSPRNSTLSIAFFFLLFFFVLPPAVVGCSEQDIFKLIGPALNEQLNQFLRLGSPSVFVEPCINPPLRERSRNTPISSLSSQPQPCL